MDITHKRIVVVGGGAAAGWRRRPRWRRRFLGSRSGAALWPHGIAVLEPDMVPPQLLARRAMTAAPPAAGPTLCWDVRGYALMESRIGADGACHMLHHYETVAKQ